LERRGLGRVGVSWRSAGAVLTLVSISLAVTLYNASSSGALWADAPCYANGAAMIHDWICSGDVLHPYEHAKKDYSRFPGFSIPFHPPGHPGLLALWFLAVGPSYIAARCFIAVCLGLLSWAFFGIVRELGASRVVAFFVALLLVTTPEIARWSRCTMSEIPALAMIAAGSYCFLRWTTTRQSRYAWGAFALAEAAFFCRLTTAGVLPAWFLFALARKESPSLFSRHVVLPASLYLVCNIAWASFASGFSRYEVAYAASSGVAFLSWDNLSYYPSVLPHMVGWLTLGAAAIGCALAARKASLRVPVLFWGSWVCAYYGFQLVVTMNEQRYFTFALPGICGLAALMFAADNRSLIRRSVGVAVMAGALAANAVQVACLPRGVVGYDAVAERLADLPEAGNVLMACPLDQDLIFRYRTRTDRQSRRLIRGDRSLAIRLADYARVAPELVAESAEDVLRVLRRGRVRYLLTPVGASRRVDDRPIEARLAHEAASSMPGRFEQLGRFPLLLETGTRRGDGRHVEVFLWRYLGDLPEGPSELPVVIPTAGLELR